LNWQRMNQQTIRAELYQGLQDAVEAGEMQAQNVGRRIVLAPTFQGGPRHMFQLYHDSMSIVAELGKPDLFITVTCNPNWPEIADELMPGQTAVDRPDLTARAFNVKLKSILNDLLKKNILGVVIGKIWVAEFQKRGLPHAHILIILGADDKPRTPDDYDAIVSAEIPDRQQQPGAFDTISSCMMHGPCGDAYPQAPCMSDGVCSKRYPRAFNEETTDDRDGYPTYRRRNNGRTVAVRKGGHVFELDNRWVVPHNPYLAKKYNCHINVEVCSSITAVKYLYKYVYKGHDRAMIEINNVANASVTPGQIDEVQRYLDARYVSASEAVWRILSFKLHDEWPNVYRLPVHLPNQQMVYFTNTDNVQNVVDEGMLALHYWQQPSF